MRPLFFFYLLLAPMTIFSGETGWETLTARDFRVPPPPKTGSKNDLQDTQAILRYQPARTAEQCKEVAEMGHASFRGLFKGVGPLTKDEYHRFKPLLKKVGALAHKIATMFKNKFNRPRPANEQSGIKPCAQIREGGSSYPSTHATVVYALACVLKQVLVKKEAAFDTYAEHVTKMRVIAGLHHPSDIAAGIQLGREICARLKTKSNFEAELKATKQN